MMLFCDLIKIRNNAKKLCILITIKIRMSFKKEEFQERPCKICGNLVAYFHSDDPYTPGVMVCKQCYEQLPDN